MITTKWAVPKQLAITSSEVGHYFQPMTVSRLPWDVQWRYPFSKVKQIWKIITMCCTVCMDDFPSIYIYIYILYLYMHIEKDHFPSVSHVFCSSLSIAIAPGTLQLLRRWHYPRESPLTRSSNVIRSKRVIGITPGWGGFL